MPEKEITELLRLSEEDRKQLYESSMDLYEFGCGITEQTENGIRRVVPLTKEWWECLDKLQESKKFT